MKILYFGTNYSDIYKLWGAHLHHKDFVLANSVPQAKFYIENYKIDLILMAHEDNPLHYNLVEWVLKDHRFIPIILCPSTMTEPWYSDLLLVMKRLQLYVCYVNPANPKDIVDLVRLKELHGMRYVASPVHDNMKHDKTPS